MDNILIDRNIYRNTYMWQYSNGTYAVRLKRSYDPAPATAAVGAVTITNNFFSSTVPFMGGIHSDAGNPSATPTGTVTIAGNTIYGPSDYGAIYITEGRAYPKEDFVVKNNVIAHVVKNYRNISASYAPASWVANGNVYDEDRPSFVWNGVNIASLAAWQTATGQDANSKAGNPLFVDAPAGDLHLDPSDTVAKGFGEDITGITDHDIDGDSRSAFPPCAGADVETTPADTDPPTITAWYSAVEHGRGVGEALLEIHDDGNFSEPRSSGISKLILVFDEPIDPVSLISVNVAIAGRDANNAPIDCNTIAIGTSTRNGHTEAVITFTPALGDYARYVVQISGVTDAVGNPLSDDADRITTALAGDASGDRRVNATDLSRVRAARTKSIDPNNAAEVRADISQDGQVNATDRSRVLARRPRDARGISDPTIP